jgi:glycosyltransferase involved in cell wall biosynthesis
MPKTDSTKIKVLLTVPHLVPTASPYRETMAIAKYLPHEEFDLTVCALRPAGLPEASAKLARFGVKSFVARFRPITLTLHGVASAVSDQKTLRDHGRFDLQHSLDFTSSPFEAFWARASGRRFIYTQRNLNEDGHPFFLKMKIGLSVGVVAISHVTQVLVQKLSAPKKLITTIPLGFDFGDFDHEPVWNPSQETPIILSVGHLQRRKRVEDAIRAVALVRETIPQTELWIIGRTYDQDYKKELLALAEALGLADSVKFLGVREDVIELMEKASALLHCAESEAFGWSLLESMAVGLPVVSYDSGGPAELIQHDVTGFLAKLGDYQACSRHLRSLLGDKELALRLSKAANAKARTDYTAEAFAEKHACFYRQFIELPGHQSVAAVAL